MADDVTGLSYEAALLELDAIIARLEGGDVELEEAINAYQRGAALTRHCAHLLDRTEQTITQLVVGGAGERESPLQITAERAELDDRPDPPPGDEASPSPAATVPRGRSVEERLFGAAPQGPARAPRGAADVDADDIPF